MSPPLQPSPSKKEFKAYLESSGANKLVARAIVGLAHEQPVNVAVFLHDFFAQGGEGDASADLSAAEKEKFSSYLRSSGATDLTTKALVGLFNAEPKPTDLIAYFVDFFKTEAGDALAPVAEEPPPPAAEAESAATDAPEPEPAAPPPAEPAAETATGAEAAAEPEAVAEPEAAAEPAGDAAAAPAEPEAAAGGDE